MQEQTTKQKKTNKITQVIKFGGGEKLHNQTYKFLCFLIEFEKSFPMKNKTQNGEKKDQKILLRFDFFVIVGVLLASDEFRCFNHSNAQSNLQCTMRASNLFVSAVS